MTYCIGMKLASGLLYMSDTRTNAGVDNISNVLKMKSWDVPGERTITMMSAGNLATTQAVTAWLDERNKAPDDRHPSILTAPSMFEVARLVGDTLRTEVDVRASQQTGQDASAFSGTLILGGQIAGADPRLYLVYPEGNFIEATDDNPFFQIGESKYGKPMLNRAFEADMDWRAALKLCLVSMDSTVQSNLSVGAPFDTRYVAEGDFGPTHERRFERDDAYYTTVSKGWGEAMRKAFAGLPDYDS